MAMSVGNSGYESFDEGGYRPMAEINITPMVDVMNQIHSFLEMAKNVLAIHRRPQSEWKSGPNGR